MKKVIDFVQRNLLLCIFSAILSGLSVMKIFGGISFTPAICLLAAFIMIYPTMIPLDFKELKNIFSNLKIIFISIFFNFIISPGVAFVLGYFFLQNNKALWIGLILISILPGGGMATTWALKSKADMSVIVSIIFSNLIIAIPIVPMILSFVLNKLSKATDILSSTIQNGNSCAATKISNEIFSCGGGVDISPMKIAIPIIFIVIVPLLLGYITQKMIIKKKGIKYFESKKDFFAKISNIGLVIILFILMTLKNNIIIFSNPGMILISFFPVVLFYFLQLLFVMSVYLKFYKNKQGKSLVWGSYLRYITLALGLSTALIYQNESLSVLVIVIIMAYFIQIPSSFMISKYFEKHN